MDGDTLYFSERLLHSYAAEVTQVIRVPEFTNVDIQPGARIVAQPWTGATGGVIAFLATGIVTNEGAIDASGSGFRGGSYVRQAPSRNCTSPSAWMERGARRGEGVDSTDPGRGSGRANIANGGGGGACMPSGGGGGGHGGPGGLGGQPAAGPRDVGGMGGARLVYSLLERLTLGGGGGGGSGWNAQFAPSSNGGQGGGAIFIRADALVGKGHIMARGEPGHDSESEGAGGGGAGGIISLRVAGALHCASLDVSGGHGGSNGATGTLAAGGGGGGGQVLYQAAWVSECAISALASPAGMSREFSGAQPDLSTLSAHSGAVTRLDGGLMRPGAATILQPEYGALVRTRTPVISGTAPVGLEVVVFVDGQEVGRTVAEGGFFEWRMSQPLSEGLHHVGVAASYLGLQGEPSLPHLLVVSAQADSPSTQSPITTLAVAPPVFTHIAGSSYSNGVPVSDLTPEIKGTASDCDSVTVTIHDGATPVQSFTDSPCDGSATGNWSVMVNVILTGSPAKTYSLSATAKKGGTTTSTTTGSFVVDTVAPAAPDIVAPANGAFVTDSKPVISGTAEDLSTIEVFIDDTLAAPSSSPTTTTGIAWSFTPMANLSSGFHWVRVRATDRAGNTGPLSKVTTFTIDTTPPGTPTVSSPGSGDYVNTVSPIIKGAAASGTTTVTVYIDGAPLAPSVKPDSLGNWSYTGALSLSAMSHNIKAEAKNAAGLSTMSGEHSFTVDVTPPETTITRPVPPFSKASSLSLSFTSNEVGATFECSTTGAAFGGCTSPKSVSTPSSGSYQFYVRAIDRAGNVDPMPDYVTWTVDMGIPSAPGFSSPGENSYTNDTTPEIRGTAEAGTTVKVFDGALELTPAVQVDSSGKWVFVPGQVWGEGLHTLTATATDQADNTSVASSTHRITIDITPPDTSISKSPSNPDSSSQPRFEFSATAGSGTVTFECSLDGEDFVSCSSPYVITLSGGATSEVHTFKVRAVDSAGNRDATPAVHTWLYDNSKIETYITGKPNALSNSPSATFTFNSNKSKATFECRYFKKPGSGSLSACTSPFNITNLTTGIYRFEVFAVVGGTSDSEGASFEWEVDVDKPATPVISSPTANAILDNNAFIVSGTADPGVSVTVLIDDENKGTVPLVPANGSWSVPVAGVQEGNRTIRAIARDAAGNLNATPPDNNFQITVDTTPPITTLGNPKPDAYSRVATAQFVFSANEPSVMFKCRHDIGSTVGTEVDCSSPWTVPGNLQDGSLSEGSHTLFVRARDAAGNYDLTPESYTWVVDTHAPETFVELKPAERTGSETVYFVFRSSESPMFFKCELDGVVSECPSNHSVIVTTQVLHTLKVWAYDRAGNEDSTPEIISWTLDKNIPSVDIASAPGNPTNDPNAVFRFTSSKEDVLFECLLNPKTDPKVDTSVVWSGCSTSFSFYVSDGEHTLWVRARDRLGNVTESSGYEKWVWRVDTNPPDTAIDTRPSEWTQQRSGSFTFSAPSETSIGGFECTLNGGAAFECPTPFTTELLADGTYTLTVRARDTAGNVDGSPAQYIWTVDNQGPDAPVPTTPAEGSIVTASNLVLEGTAEPMARVVVLLGTREVGSTTANNAGVWRLELTEALLDGPYQFVLNAYDRADNKSEISSTLSLAIDATNPESLFLEGPGDRERIRTRATTFRIGASEAATLECSLDGNTPYVCGEETFSCRAADDSPAPCGVTLPLENLSEGDHDLVVSAKDKAGNVESSAKIRRWRVYLGGDSKAMGGGLSCAASGGGAPSLGLFGLAVMALLSRRKRRA